MRWHALVFVLLNAFVITINLVFSPSVLWFLWVTGPWAMGLVLHAFGAMSSSDTADAREDVAREGSPRRSSRRRSKGHDRASFSSAPTEHALGPASNDDPTQLRTQRRGALQSGQRVADRFVIERALGAGGMGEVYIALDTTLHEKVALKTIATSLAGPDAVDRFRREAQAARRITHPNVVRIHDIGQHTDPDGTLSFISMEYIEGRSLGQHIAKQGPLSTLETKRIALQLCDGLQAAHSAGVIHRDLKPDNVLLDQQDQVRVIDFGLARVEAHTGLTATGAVMGTPGYMAPEQVLGKASDARTDIYAVGCILYHALAGVPPFTRDSAIAVGFAHCYDAPPALSGHRGDLTGAWETLVMRALAKEPDQRFESATALHTALEQLPVD